MVNLFFIILIPGFFMSSCGEKKQAEEANHNILQKDNKANLSEEILTEKILNQDIQTLDTASDLPECDAQLVIKFYYLKNEKILKLCSYDEETKLFAYKDIKGDDGLEGLPGLDGEGGLLKGSTNTLPEPTFSLTTSGLDFILTMQKQGQSDIFYTTNGLLPTINSEIYNPNGITVKCCNNMTFKAFQAHWAFENSSIATYDVNFLYEFGFKFGFSGEGDGAFDYPRGIAIDSNGNIYVADEDRNNVQKFNSEGRFIFAIEYYGEGESYFDEPLGVVVDSEDNVYVLDEDRRNVQKFNEEGDFLFSIEHDEEEDEDYFEGPDGIAIDRYDNIYVVDDETDTLKKFDSEGNLVLEFGSEGYGDRQFSYPRAVAVDLEGYIYIADSDRDDVQKFDPDGEFVLKFGSSGEEDGQLESPRGIAIDRKGNLYIADSSRDDIQKFDLDGNFVSKFGSNGEEDGQFEGPRGIAVDRRGYIYITDTSRENVQKILPINQ